MLWYKSCCICLNHASSRNQRRLDTMIFKIILACVVFLHQSIAEGQQGMCPMNCEDYATTSQAMEATLAGLQESQNGNFTEFENKVEQLQDGLKASKKINDELLKKLKRQAKKISEIEGWIEVLGRRDWSEWGEWSACSLTCGTGERRQERSCIGKLRWRNFCTGASTKIESCTQVCAPDQDVGKLECHVRRERKCFSIINAGRDIDRPSHEKICNRHHGGHLANVYDNEHFEALNTFIFKNVRSHRYLWTGMNYFSNNQTYTLHDGSSAPYSRWMLGNGPAPHWLWTGILFYSQNDEQFSRLMSSFKSHGLRSGFRNMQPDSGYQYSICEFPSNQGSKYTHSDGDLLVTN